MLNSSLFYWGSQPSEWCCQHVGWIFLPQPNLGNPSQTYQENCFHSDSKSHQIDKMNHHMAPSRISVGGIPGTPGSSRRLASHCQSRAVWFSPVNTTEVKVPFASDRQMHRSKLLAQGQLLHQSAVLNPGLLAQKDPQGALASGFPFSFVCLLVWF